MHTYTLPGGAEVEIREMTGVEEDLLTNERMMRNGSAINKVLTNCVVRIGDNTDPVEKDILDLLAGDRLFLLVRLREVSLGETMALNLKCSNPGCRQDVWLETNLADLPVTAYGPDREFTLTLPGSQNKVVFGLLDGHCEKRLAAIKQPDLTTVLLMRIRTIDGKPPNKKIVREWPVRDRNALREAMRKVDGGINTQVSCECDACGAPITTRLEGLPDFLFPGQT